MIECLANVLKTLGLISGTTRKKGRGDKKKEKKEEDGRNYQQSKKLIHKIIICKRHFMNNMSDKRHISRKCREL